MASAIKFFLFGINGYLTTIEFDQSYEEFADLERKIGEVTDNVTGTFNIVYEGEQITADSFDSIQFTDDNKLHITVRDYYIYDMLLECARKGNVNDVRLLLNKGVPIDYQDDEGWTPLFFAIFSDHKKVVELLLEKGADMYHIDFDGYTASDIAIKFKCEKMVELLEKHGVTK